MLGQLQGLREYGHTDMSLPRDKASSMTAKRPCIEEAAHNVGGQCLVGDVI